VRERERERAHQRPLAHYLDAHHILHLHFRFANDTPGGFEKHPACRLTSKSECHRPDQRSERERVRGIFQKDAPSLISLCQVHSRPRQIRELVRRFASRRVHLTDCRGAKNSSSRKAAHMINAFAGTGPLLFMRAPAISALHNKLFKVNSH
jgi:hypothetical protein